MAQKLKFENIFPDVTFSNRGGDFTVNGNYKSWNISGDYIQRDI